MANRWWIYQKERFPVFSHGILIFAFSFCAVCYSSLLRNGENVSLPSAIQIFISFAVVFIFFVLLRIADEFKDFEEDSEFRPYRPVPRGLVSLRELGKVAVMGCVLQLILSMILQPMLAIVLVVGWVYLALMTKEFFFAKWLKAHPITYLWTHMFIMPLVDLYATACNWALEGQIIPPKGLIWFLLVSFFNGIVIEIGRKIRAPEDEEKGVDTYSVLWGRRNASLAWLGAILTGGVFAVVAGSAIDFLVPLMVILLILYSMCAICATRYVLNPTTNHAKMIENLSGIWVIGMYLSLGAIPLWLTL